MGGAFFVLCRCLCRAVVLRQPFSFINVVATMRLPLCDGPTIFMDKKRDALCVSSMGWYRRESNQ